MDALIIGGNKIDKDVTLHSSLFQTSLTLRHISLGDMSCTISRKGCYIFQGLNQMFVSSSPILKVKQYLSIFTTFTIYF